MAKDRVAQVAIPPGITPADLHAAYLLAELGRLGYGYEKAMSVPHIARGIIGTALERKTHKMRRQHRELAAGQMKINFVEG